MRPTRLKNLVAGSLAAAGFAAAFASPAGAASPHVVQPGETLWSIAAANNLTTRTVAAVAALVAGVPPDGGEACAGSAGTRPACWSAA